jgi:hypothetical protein
MSRDGLLSDSTQLMLQQLGESEESSLKRTG